jgi:hypothetical protein
VQQSLGMKKNGALLITALTLQVTACNGKAPIDVDEFIKESMEYWEQPKACQQLQVAMAKMKWPVFEQEVYVPSPAKKLKQ